MTVTGASADGAILIGVSTDYGASPDEVSTRFVWNEAVGMAALAPGGPSDVGFGDVPKLSFDGRAAFGVLVKRVALDPSSKITYPYAFYRWTSAAGYVPFGPRPELTDGQLRHLSDDGTVAVGLASASPDRNVYARFRWTLTGGYRELAGFASWPPLGEDVAMSRDGRVILAVDGDPSHRPFVWSDGGKVEIPPLPGRSSCVPHLLSGTGRVVFGRCAAPEAEAGRRYQTFRWTATAPLAPVAIGETGDDVIATIGDGTVAMGNGSAWLTRWTESEGVVHIAPPEAVFSVRDYSFGMDAAGMSPDGTSVYGAMVPLGRLEELGGSGSEFFHWSIADGFVRLRPLPGDDVSMVSSASAEGTLHVGLSRLGRLGKARAVLWDGRGARDIAAELTAAGIDLGGAELSMASMVWSGPMIKVVGSGAVAGQGRAWIAWLPARR